jgi:nickel-dependent lactate racemase
MRLKVHYGCGVQEIEVPDTCKVEVLEGQEGSGVDEQKVLQDAVDHPLDSPSLEEFLKDGKVLILVNDGDRPTPTPKFLKCMIDKIEHRPETRFLICCGTHRQPMPEDLRMIFGEFYERVKDKIFYHDARDGQSLVKIGRTSSGNEIFMNIHVTWADKLIITGSVEPHYFAGFTGGRKWVIGVAGFESIERNHKLALKDEAATLALDGNPLHDELVEWDRLIDKPKFCINIVQDKNMAIAAAFAGNIEKVFEECVKVGLGMYSAPTEGNADIVLTVSRAPQDSNLYQALKAQEHGKLAMKNGAIIILVAECRLGVGPKHFSEMLKGMDIEMLLKNIETDFHLGQHKIAKMLNTMKRGKLWVVTDIPAEDVAAIQMERFPTVQEAIDKAFMVKGKDAKLIFLPDGGMTVPQILKRSHEHPLKEAVVKVVKARLRKRISRLKERVRGRLRKVSKRGGRKGRKGPAGTTKRKATRKRPKAKKGKRGGQRRKRK